MNFYLEQLETRQLLATIVGGGEEVGSDLDFQNNIYDQILMVGSSVTVAADQGQIVRTSYLDSNGDIIQAEFSGAGTLSIFLDDFTSPSEALNYNQPGVEYVSGQASFAIEGSDETTNFSLHSVGAITSTVWDSLKVEGVDYDGIADATRVTIIADPNNANGSVFGGIRMANSFLSGDVGIVGISAKNVHVQNMVIIGDIDAGGLGVPSLRFGSNSEFKTVSVAGGDLDQSNGLDIAGASFEIIEFIEGTTSHGELLNAETFHGEWKGNFLPSEINFDSLTLGTIDITGFSQTELDSTFGNKTFKNDIFIQGDLPSHKYISAWEFQNNVTFDGVYHGPISIAEGIKGDLVFLDHTSGVDSSDSVDRTISSDITIGGEIEGALNFGQNNDGGVVNYNGNLTAAAINDIYIYGDFNGILTTDLNSNGTFDDGESTLGDIFISGDCSGSVLGILGIGDIFIKGNLTTTANEGATAFYTSSNTDDSSFANIGSLTIEGDIDQGDSSDKLIEVNKNGNFGNIVVLGNGNLGSNDGTDFLSVGKIITGGILGNDNLTGNVTISESIADVELLGIDINVGELGNISIEGSGAPDSDLLITGDIGGTTAIIGDINVTGFQTIKQDAYIMGVEVGEISYKTSDSTEALNTAIDLNKFIISDGVVGAVVLDADESNSSIDVDYNFIDAGEGSGSIGALNIVGETITLGQINADVVEGIVTIGSTEINDEIAANTFGPIRIEGDLSFTDGGVILSKKYLDSFEVSGDTTFGNLGLRVADTGLLEFGGSVTFYAAGLSIIADDGTSDRDLIEGINFGGIITGGYNFDIQASAIGDITIEGKLNEGEILVNQLGIAAINNSGTLNNAETVAIDGTNLSNYTIGNITIKSTYLVSPINNWVFDGASFFQALGNIGDISINAVGGNLLQTALFYDSTAKIDFIVGNGRLANTADAGIDFDGDGIIGRVQNDSSITLNDELSANFTSGNVSVGDVSVNASGLGISNNNTVKDVTQLLVLSGVEAPSGSHAFDGNYDTVSPNDPASSVQSIDENLEGTIGDVFITNSNIQLSAVTTAAPLSLDSVTKTGGIFASDAIGEVQGVNYSSDLNSNGEGILIGNNNTETDTNIGADEVIVMIV